MRIGSVQHQQGNTWNRLSAKVEFRTHFLAVMPETLWFQMESRHGDYTSADGLDSFLLALLFPAMLLGESIELDGPVSAELLEGVLVVQQIFHAWYPELRPVAILPKGGIPAPPQQLAPGNGFCFSGGVDSLFSLKSFLDHPNLRVRPTHLFFGLFGPPLTWRKQAIFDQTIDHFQPFITRMGLDLVTASSNLSDFYEPLNLWWGHVTAGLATAAMAHLYPGIFNRFILPSSHFHQHLYPNGSSPLSDPLLSSEWTRIINHGSRVTRVDKTILLSQWEPAYSILNVCAVRNHPIMNCGCCEKCWRTMLTLACVDGLEKFSTFPLHRNEQNQMIMPGWRPETLITNQLQAGYYREILQLAENRGKSDLINAVRNALSHYENNRQRSVEWDRSKRPYSWMKPFV